MHRDVKAENVLVISDEHVKLGDFGFSTQISGPLHYLNTFCGSPPYASPELFNDDHYVGKKIIGINRLCTLSSIFLKIIAWISSRYLGVRDFTLLHSHREHAIFSANSSTTTLNNPQRRISNSRIFYFILCQTYS